MTLPLFGETTRPAGPLRRVLDAKITTVRAAGVELDDDLALIARSLADRIDAQNVNGDRRGYVLLTGEYRQARGDLFAPAAVGGGTGDDDAFSAALDAFRRSAEAGVAPDPG